MSETTKDTASFLALPMFRRAFLAAMLSRNLKKVGATIRKDGKGFSDGTLHFADVDGIKAGLTPI